MLSSKKFNNILLWILLFFGLFDTARNYTYLPIFVGYLKDIAVYLLLFLNIGNIKINLKIGLAFYFCFFLVALTTPLGFLYSEYDKTKILIACFKYTEFFVLVILFLNWNRIFSTDVHKFVKSYVLGSFVLCFVNIVGYYVPNPIVSVHLANSNMIFGQYGGRVTVGQPPVAIFPVIISSIYILINMETKKQMFSFLFFLLCIFIAISNTGIVAEVVSITIVLIYAITISNLVRLKNYLFYSILCLLFGSIIFYMFCSSYFADGMYLYESKILKFLSGNTDLQMDIRRSHWEDAFSTLEGIELFFGRGAYGYVVGNNSFLIENTFVSTFVQFGLFSFLFMIVFWIRQCFFFLEKLLKEKSKDSLFCFCVACIILLHNYTLDSYLCFTMYFAAALFVSYFYIGEKNG